MNEETHTIHLPTEDLTRATPGGLTLRSTPDGPPILEGHGAVFNQWTKIDSMMEGTFMERVMPGSFTKSLAETTPKILFQHGQDPMLGNQILAPTEAAGEDETGLFYRGALLDGIPPLIVNGLKAGVYGSSFRFSVVRGKDAIPAKRDAAGNFPAYNPDGLPERTIREVKLVEMGPVTWPAYPGADAGIRSLTDRFALQRLASDPEHLEELVEELPADIAEKPQVTPEPTPTPSVTSVPAPTDAPPVRVASTSSVARKETAMAETPEERASRMSELEASIKRVAESYTGKLPPDVEVAYETEKAELARLVEDEAAYQSRKADLKKLENSINVPPPPSPINVIKKPDNIFGGAAFADINTRSRSLDEMNQLRRDYAMRGVETAKFGPNADEQRSKDRIEWLVDSLDAPTRDNPDHELARRIIGTGGPAYKRAFENWLKVQGKYEMLNQQDADVLRGTALGVQTTTTGGSTWGPELQ